MPSSENSQPKRLRCRRVQNSGWIYNRSRGCAENNSQMERVPLYAVSVVVVAFMLAVFGG